MMSARQMPGDTQTVRQPPTRTGAVGRYVGIPLGDRLEPKLIHNNKGIAPGRGRAEQNSRAEHLMQTSGGIDQAEKKARPTDQAEQSGRDEHTL